MLSELLQVENICAWAISACHSFCEGFCEEAGDTSHSRLKWHPFWRQTLWYFVLPRQKDGSSSMCLWLWLSNACRPPAADIYIWARNKVQKRQNEMWTASPEVQGFILLFNFITCSAANKICYFEAVEILLNLYLLFEWIGHLGDPHSNTIKFTSTETQFKQIQGEHNVQKWNVFDSAREELLPLASHCFGTL